MRVCDLQTIFLGQSVKPPPFVRVSPVSNATDVIAIHKYHWAICKCLLSFPVVKSIDDWVGFALEMKVGSLVGLFFQRNLVSLYCCKALCESVPSFFCGFHFHFYIRILIFQKAHLVLFGVIDLYVMNR